MKENMVHLSKDFKTAFKTGRKESSHNHDKNALEDGVAPQSGDRRARLPGLRRRFNEVLVTVPLATNDG